MSLDFNNGCSVNAPSLGAAERRAGRSPDARSAPGGRGGPFRRCTARRPRPPIWGEGDGQTAGRRSARCIGGGIVQIGLSGQRLWLRPAATWRGRASEKYRAFANSSHNGRLAPRLPATSHRDDELAEQVDSPRSARRPPSLAGAPSWGLLTPTPVHVRSLYCKSGQNRPEVSMIRSLRLPCPAPPHVYIAVAGLGQGVSIYALQG